MFKTYFINSVLFQSSLMKNRPTVNIHNKVSSSFIPYLGAVTVLPENADVFTKYIYAVLSCSVLILWCFISIVGYIITMYVINKQNISERYPKLSGIIKYYSLSSTFFILIDIVIIFIMLFMIIGLSLLFIYSNSIDGMFPTDLNISESDGNISQGIIPIINLKK